MRRSSCPSRWAAAAINLEISKRCSVIIFLNGVSSSGKSSVARALQDAWITPLVHVGVDTFIDMIPARFCGEGQEARYGLQFVPVQTREGPVVEIRAGPYAKRLFAGMIGTIGALARARNDIIVDEVLFGDDMLREYVRELQGQTVYFVAIHCTLEIVEQRERERGDRFINSAKAQFPLVHGPTRSYDLELDTSLSSPDQLADAIKEYVTNTPGPQGFVAMERVFGI
jgi:chloramphenicol 3-O phosphotransferase